MLEIVPLLQQMQVQIYSTKLINNSITARRKLLS